MLQITRLAVITLMARFNETGSVSDRPRSRPATKATEDVKAMLDRVQREQPDMSSPAMSK